MYIHYITQENALPKVNKGFYPREKRKFNMILAIMMLLCGLLRKICLSTWEFPVLFPFM